MARPSFVVTVATGVIATASTACCPTDIKANDACHFYHSCGDLSDDCGFNGFECNKGKWRAAITYCNPAAPPRPPPTSGAKAGATGSAVADDGKGPLQSDALVAFIDKPLSDLLRRLSLVDEGIRYHDEPPGKLRSFSVELPSVPRPDSLPSATPSAAVDKPTRELRIYLHYDAKFLFSAERHWPLAKIGGAKVLGIRLREATQTRNFGVLPSSP